MATLRTSTVKPIRAVRCRIGFRLKPLGKVARARARAAQRQEEPPATEAKGEE